MKSPEVSGVNPQNRLTKRAAGAFIALAATVFVISYEAGQSGRAANHASTSVAAHNSSVSQSKDSAHLPANNGDVIAAVASNAATAARKPIIVIDPGHSGKDISITDPATGLIDHDYENDPEMADVFAVAQIAKAKLETDGYTVILTKTSEAEYVSNRGRAEVANGAHADLALSIHTDHSLPYGQWAQIYPQQVGQWRGGTAAAPTATFTQTLLAAKSERYSEIFKAAREAAEHDSVSITADNFGGRPGIEPGTIPLVELFSQVPWVYNEIGGLGDGDGTLHGLGPAQRAAFATGIINGVEQSIPLDRQ